MDFTQSSDNRIISILKYTPPKYNPYKWKGETLDYKSDVGLAICSTIPDK